MPEVKVREEAIQPASLSGLWRSSFAQLYIFQDRPAPTFAFMFALALWAGSICRIIWPSLVDPASAEICLLRDLISRPHTSEWRRFLLHAFWPSESGYVRAFFTSAALLLLGYAYEYEVGTARFASLFMGIHAACAALLLHFRFTACYISIDSTLVALAVVMHRANPKVHTDGLDKAVRVEWPIEPRWHLWIIISLLLLLANNFPNAFSSYSVGLLVGGICTLRDPDTWLEGWNVACARSPGIGRIVHLALFLFAILFMPLTTPGAQVSVIGALMDGSAFRPSWWRTNVTSSPALLHLAVAGQLGDQALWILRLLIAFGFPLLLTPFRKWTKGYSVACVILIMYTMNSPVWLYPHIGFLALVYLTWAFWTLPNVQPVGYRLS